MVSKAEGSLGREMKWADLEILSIIVRITELPSETGKPVTKSRAMCDQRHPMCGSDCSKPDRVWLTFLFWEQVEHAATNSFVSGVEVVIRTVS